MYWKLSDDYGTVPYRTEAKFELKFVLIFKFFLKIEKRKQIMIVKTPTIQISNKMLAIGTGTVTILYDVFFAVVRYGTGNFTKITVIFDCLNSNSERNESTYVHFVSWNATIFHTNFMEIVLLSFFWGKNPGSSLVQISIYK